MQHCEKKKKNITDSLYEPTSSNNRSTPKKKGQKLPTVGAKTASRDGFEALKGLGLLWTQNVTRAPFQHPPKNLIEEIKLFCAY